MPPSESSASITPVLSDETSRLRRAVEELSILNDLARTISASLDPQEVMDVIIRRSLRAVQAEQGVITMVEQQAADPLKTLVRAMNSTKEHEHLRPTQNLLGWMHLNKKPLLLNSPRTDPRFQGVEWASSMQSVMCVPLMIKSELKGVLTVYNKRGNGGFTDDDQRVLAIIGGQSAQVIENARLNEHEKQFLKMQEELRLAYKIQMDLLPAEAPSIPGYDVAAKTITEQLVGGDYFDFIPGKDGTLAVCVGDVSGKGLPAALLMANTQATLRGQSLVANSVTECITRSNTLLYQSTSAEKFVTLFYGVLDYKNHVLVCSNAGHEHPYHFSNAEQPSKLEKGGTALGMLDSFPYDEETVPLAIGDTIVMFSDGISEAMDDKRAQFGAERLEALIRQHRQLSAAALIGKIVEAVQWHSGLAPQTDDMTLLVIKRTG